MLITCLKFFRRSSKNYAACHRWRNRKHWPAPKNSRTTAMTHKITLSITALTLLLAQARSAQNLGNTSPKEAVRRELVKIGEEDQKRRQEMADLLAKLTRSNREKVEKKLKVAVEEQNALDSRNKQRLDEIVKEYGWPKTSAFGQEASGVAFLIVQRAELEYQKKYFPLIKEAAARNEARPSDLAMLEDRILIG